MIQTRRELLDEFLHTKNALGDDNQRKLASLVLNRAYMDVWLAHPWTDHRLPNPIEITTVASQRAYPLPGYFGRVPNRLEFLRNLTTGDTLAYTSLDAIEKEDPASGTSLEQAATPLRATIAGWLGVSTQPSSAGQALEVLSDSALDTDVRVLVEGVNSTGAWDETQVTLTGTVAVAIGTWKTPLVTFAKTYPAGTDPATPETSSRGTVTLRVVAGATLQTLLPEESARAFPSLILSPKPVTAGETIAVPAFRAPKRLVYDSDVTPRFWGSAIIERMNDLWGVADDAKNLPIRIGPQLAQLIGFDNTAAPGRIRVNPFRG